MKNIFELFGLTIILSIITVFFQSLLISILTSDEITTKIFFPLLIGSLVINFFVSLVVLNNMEKKK